MPENAGGRLNAGSASAPRQQEDTLVKMVDVRAERYGDRTVMERKRDGIWQAVSWRDLSRSYREVARGLLTLGLEKGDRMAILSENRPEWAFADLGCFAMEGVVVPLYWTLTPAQVEYILRDCSARVVFVSNAQYLDTVLKVKPGLPELKYVIYFDPVPADRLEDGVLSMEELMQMGRDAPPEAWETMGRCIAEACGKDLATIIYTSGTTGEPKGVMISHDNFLSNLRSVLEVIDVKDTDICLSFLPLSHVFERIAYYLWLYIGGTIAYAESIDNLMDNMAEVRPTILVSVPRIYEKAYGRILDRVRDGSLLARLIFVWSLGVGRKVSTCIQGGSVPQGWLAVRQRIADRLVFSKLRERFGGRIRLMISGGAPLSKVIAEFFHAAGLTILEGYGLTETSPVITANRLDRLRFGSVGITIPGVEVRIAEDGEILTRGPHVMMGYYNLPQETEEAIDGEGWFYTGDIGFVDEDGFLHITDRKKAIIVTAGGKNVAPAAIENALSADKFISQAFAYGDGRKYISALIVPDWERVESYAKEHKIQYSTLKDLCQDKVIVDLIQKRVDAALVDMSSFEQVKRFKLLDREFSQEAGEVTPTLKLKRKEITQRFWQDLDSLYD
ncbi:MAG: long-chain fatty acid--CoA ligase [bacterium]|nr:MAG: long-chain fatty acid--CoA ligase [bacterium]